MLSFLYSSRGTGNDSLAASKLLSWIAEMAIGARADRLEDPILQAWVHASLPRARILVPQQQSRSNDCAVFALSCLRNIFAVKCEASRSMLQCAGLVGQRAWKMHCQGLTRAALLTICLSLGLSPAVAITIIVGRLQPAAPLSPSLLSALASPLRLPKPTSPMCNSPPLAVHSVSAPAEAQSVSCSDEADSMVISHSRTLKPAEAVTWGRFFATCGRWTLNLQCAPKSLPFSQMLTCSPLLESRTMRAA